MTSEAARMHQVLYVVRVVGSCRFEDQGDLFKVGMSDDWGRRRAQHVARFGKKKKVVPPAAGGGGATVVVQEVLVLEVASSAHAERAALAALAADPDVAATFRAELGREFFQAACSRQVMRCVMAACEPFLRAPLVRWSPPLARRGEGTTGSGRMGGAVVAAASPAVLVETTTAETSSGSAVMMMRSEDELAAAYLAACPDDASRTVVVSGQQCFVRCPPHSEWRPVPRGEAARVMAVSMRSCCPEMRLSESEGRVRLGDARACLRVLDCVATRMAFEGRETLSAAPTGTRSGRCCRPGTSSTA